MFQRMNVQKRSKLWRRDLKSEVGVTLKLIKMFKLKSKLIVVIMVMFEITAFMGCEKSKVLESESNTLNIGITTEVLSEKVNKISTFITN